MKKRVLILIIIIIVILAALIVLMPFLIKYYNSYAQKQRQDIKYCDIDEDCIIQDFNLKDCGRWSGCFNKNEKPRSDIGFQSAMCDYPPRYCKCESGKCVECLSENC